MKFKKSIDKNEKLQRQKAIAIFKNMKDFFRDSQKSSLNWNLFQKEKLKKMLKICDKDKRGSCNKKRKEGHKTKKKPELKNKITFKDQKENKWD